MSKGRFRIAMFSALVFAAIAQAAHAQGIQPFSTQAPGPSTSVDLATGNILISIPIRSKMGAIPFQYSLIGNSSPLTGTGLSGRPTGPTGLLGAVVIQGTPTITRCSSTGFQYIYNNWKIGDSTGATHTMAPGTLNIILVTPTGCGTPVPQSITATTQDGSGYTLSVSTNGVSITGETIFDQSGNTYPILTSDSMTDPDGNSISAPETIVPPTSSVYTYTDTLGQVALVATKQDPVSTSTPDTYVCLAKTPSDRHLRSLNG